MFRGRTVGVLIAAAGCGSRLGARIPKQFLPVYGVPMVLKTAGVFQDMPEVDRIWVVTQKRQMEYCERLLQQGGIGKLQQVLEGGTERQDSVQNGLAAMTTDLVLIHDAARPFVTEDCVRRVLGAAEKSGAAICGVPVKDTIRCRGNTLDRRQLFAVQTPQGFERRLLAQIMKKARQYGWTGTDEAGLADRAGIPVQEVKGSYSNVKITTKEDLPVEVRTGTGYDVHRLVPNRRLVLGGIFIPHTAGLEGHSDADVLVHAVMDALLGAAALGDIGQHFPDTDPEYKGISSLHLLKEVKKLLEHASFSIGNIDGTLIAQKPRMKEYLPAMAERIAAACGIAPDCVSVKATTTEGLGFAGREEGIAAQAVCTLYR